MIGIYITHKTVPNSRRTLKDYGILSFAWITQGLLYHISFDKAISLCMHVKIIHVKNVKKYSNIEFFLYIVKITYGHNVLLLLPY